MIRVEVKFTAVEDEDVKALAKFSNEAFDALARGEVDAVEKVFTPEGLFELHIARSFSSENL